MLRKRAYKYRFFPTPERANVLARTFGSARFVYTSALRLRHDASTERGERLRYAETSAAQTALRRELETAWRNEVSSVPTQRALRHLDRAFRTCFAGRATYPTFHKKHGTQSAKYSTSAFRWDADAQTLTLAKMEEPLAIHWSRPPPALPDGVQPSMVTVSRDTADRSFVSLLVEEEIASLPPVAAQVGLDLERHDVVVFDPGEQVGNPTCFAREERRVAKAQRQLTKKQRGSRNRAKARVKVARIHTQISDRRRDVLHQRSTRTLRGHQAICVESLRVQAMVKRPSTHPGTHPGLAKAIHKAIHHVGWSEFVRQLTYTAASYGRTLVAIDQWAPSRKRCSACGQVLGSLALETRVWTCPACGAVHDREVNAAKNVKAEGLDIRGLQAAGLAVSADRGAGGPGAGSPVVGGSR